MAAFVQRAINDPGVAPRWHAGIELAAQMDLVHVIGGGFINGLWPRHIGLLAGSWQQPGARAAVPGRRSARCHRSALAVPALPDAPDGRGCWCRGSRCRQLEVLHQQAPFPDRARLWLDPQSGVEEGGFAGPGGFSAPVLCSLRELKAGLASSIYARSESAGSPGRPPGREAAAHSAVWNLVSPPLWRRAAAFVGRPARADPLQKELDRDEVRFGATPVEQATGGTAS